MTRAVGELGRERKTKRISFSSGQRSFMTILGLERESQKMCFPLNELRGLKKESIVGAVNSNFPLRRGIVEVVGERCVLVTAKCQS